jgi:hypothetical protein
MCGFSFPPPAFVCTMSPNQEHSHPSFSASSNLLHPVSTTLYLSPSSPLRLQWNPLLENSLLSSVFSFELFVPNCSISLLVTVPVLELSPQ